MEKLEQFIEFMNKEVEQVELAVQTGKYLDPLDEMKEKDVTELHRNNYKHIVNYINKYLIPNAERILNERRII